LPRAIAARTAVEQRGPGHRDPCGVISRQARHTRSPWESGHASGGAAPVERCTERRWDTNDCRQLHPVGDSPSRRAHLGIGKNHIPDGCVGAVVRGRHRGVLGCNGTLACPHDKGPSVSMGPAAGGGAFRVPPCVPTCVGPRSVSIVASGGHGGASPVSPCISPRTGSGSVTIGIAWGSRGAGPCEGGPACAGASGLDGAPPRGWKSVRRAEVGGPSEDGRGLAVDRVVGALTGGPVGWKRCKSHLRSTFPGRLPRCSVSVWRCAAMS